MRGTFPRMTSNDVATLSYTICRRSPPLTLIHLPLFDSYRMFVVEVVMTVEVVVMVAVVIAMAIVRIKRNWHRTIFIERTIKSIFGWCPIRVFVYEY